MIAATVIMKETKSTTPFVVSPANIAVIGGGRWARVLTEIVYRITDHSINISIHSPGNASSMQAWVEEKGWKSRIKITDTWPTSFQGSAAVIVANATVDHEKAIRAAFLAGAAVLVEKPMTLTYASAQDLIAVAENKNFFFATAHVFLFTRYLPRFAESIAAAGEVSAVKIIWRDPQLESRYGEQKRYDAGLPVFVDWLPHILSILYILIKEAPQNLTYFALQKGGAKVTIAFNAGTVSCQVEMERNGRSRKRLLEVMAGDQLLKLDFSAEPGNIDTGTDLVNADPDWNTADRPATSMLKAFLQQASGIGTDERLDPLIGLRASKMISEVTDLYRPEQMLWLTEKLGTEQIWGEDTRYALIELLQVNDHVRTGGIDRKVEKIKNLLAGSSRKHWLTLLREKKDPAVLLEMTR